jgi:hypothetical protein
VGHERFIDIFAAVFDGKQTTLELRPNGGIPLVQANWFLTGSHAWQHMALALGGAVLSHGNRNGTWCLAFSGHDSRRL